MFLRRQPKNRHLGRDHVLDVKLRSSKVRAARTRFAAIGFGVVFGLLFGLFLIWRTGQWTLNKLVYENDAFSIEHIEVQTDGLIAGEQLRRWAGVKTQQNLLALDLGRVKRDLELVPMVQTASIERLLPHTLRLHISEREPIAQIKVAHLRAGGGFEIAAWQLDAEGYVMPPLEAGQRTGPVSPVEQLPTITGLSAMEVQPGRRVDVPQLQAALKLVIAFDHSPMAEVAELRRIDVSASDVLLVTSSQGAAVTLGLDNLDEQLRRWRAIYDLGQKMSKLVATLDLAITDNIPATWLEASAVPALPPRQPKDPRTKRKHV